MARLYTARVASLLGTLVAVVVLSVAATPGVSLAVDSWGATGSGYIAATNVHTVTSSVRSLSPSSSSPATWQIQAKFPSIPFNPGLHNFQVSCVSSTFCMAVGYNSNGAVALSFNGTSWKRQIVPSGVSALRSVSCASATFCMMLGGDSNNNDITLSFNGTSWKRQSLPSGVSSLSPVSCASATFCEAVGLDSNYNPIALAFNGSTWKMHLISSGDSYSNSLFDFTSNSVSCPSSTFCMAVGSNSNDNIALSFNGTSWKRQSLPSGVSSLSPVSCASATFCMMLGWDSNDNTIPLAFNGSTWKRQNLPVTTGTIDSVSCPSPTFCEAVGWDIWGPNSVVWNGTRWSAQVRSSGLFNNLLCVSPRTTTADTSDFGCSTLFLTGVSCASAAFCETVGSNLNLVFLTLKVPGRPSPLLPPSTKVLLPFGALVVADRIRQARHAWRLRSARHKGTGMQEPSQPTSGGRIRRILNSPDSLARRLSSKVSFLRGRQDLVRRLMPLAIFQAASVAFIADEVAVGDFGVGTIINMGLFVLSSGMSVRDILHARSAPDAPVQPADVNALETISAAPMQSGASGDLLFDPAPISTQVAVSVPIGDLTCPSCGTTNVATSRFCKSCGSALLMPASTSVPIGDLTCPSCGTTNTAASRFCKSCGSALSV